MEPLFAQDALANTLVVLARQRSRSVDDASLLDNMALEGRQRRVTCGTASASLSKVGFLDRDVGQINNRQESKEKKAAYGGREGVSHDDQC